MLRVLLLFILAALPGCSGGQGEAVEKRVSVLRILGYAEYLPPSVQAQFEKEYGCGIQYVVYDSDDEFLGRVQSRPEDYDVVIGSHEQLQQLQLSGVLLRFDKSKLSGLGDLYPELYPLPGDPEGAHAVPYCWGGYAIAYRKSATADLPKDIGLLFNPLAGGRVLMSNDMEASIMAANFAQGRRPSGFDRESLKAAADFLRLQQTQMQVTYGSDDDFLTGMRDGTWAVALGFTGDAWRVAEDDPDIGCFILDGFPVWLDGMAISRDSAVPGLAQTFVNFCLRPAVLAEISGDICYPSGSAAALALTDPALAANPLLFPPPDSLRTTILTRLMTDGEFALLASATRFILTGEGADRLDPPAP